MALLDAMPNQAIIKNMHGILDFYRYKDLVVVRTWPCKPQLTPAMVRTHRSLRRGLKLWKEVPLMDYEAYTYAVRQSEFTNRDMFLSNILRLKTPRSLITLNSVVLIGNYIYVNFDLLQGDKPLLSVNWLDSMEPSVYINWTKAYKKESGYYWPSKVNPHFNTGYMKTISWLNSHGFFIFRNRYRCLFFHFTDPYNLTKFSSGVYHYDFRP